MNYYHYLLLFANIVIALTAAWHALLFKRDPRASIGWIAVIILFPLMGPFLYFLLGINRIKIRAHKLSDKSPSGRSAFTEEKKPLSLMEKGIVHKKYKGPASISDKVTLRPLAGNNCVEVFYNGENAYPAMLKAIDEARDFVHLSTYIFETNRTGRLFIDSLANAFERGLDVKVIIDGIGEYYSFPKAGRLLKKRGVRVARYLPPSLIPPSIHINLRNHRKILIVDGKKAFVGGMNIGDRHLADNPNNKSRMIDAHFLLQGPVVSQVQEVFAVDWNFVTKENFRPVFTSERSNLSCDMALCRVITDGPDEDMDKLAIILAGVISSAKDRVMIMSPYFLPTRDIISALQAAALRDVEVDILLPSVNNIPFVHWATRNMLWELLQRGVNIYYQPPPFVHTKLLVVDDYYAQIGTANMDSRSLRLNFELVVEIFDELFVSTISEHILKCREKSTKVKLEEMDSRNYLARTRDSLAWLFYPYL